MSKTSIAAISSVEPSSHLSVLPSSKSSGVFMKQASSSVKTNRAAAIALEKSAGGKKARRILARAGVLGAQELASTNDDDGGGSVVSAAVNPLMVVEKKGGKNKKWRVSVELSPQSCQVQVPMAAVGSAYELKQAIVEACLANLGPDGTPALWLEGDLDTMAVQFLDSETGSAVTLKESTDFGRILAARTVRVTKREFKQPKTLTHRADVELGAVNMED